MTFSPYLMFFNLNCYLYYTKQFLNTLINILINNNDVNVEIITEIQFNLLYLYLFKN